MTISKELLYQELGKHVLDSLGEVDLGAMADKKAILILDEIQQLFLRSKDDLGDLSPEQSAQQDFEILDQIIAIFHRNGLQTGNLHDY